MSNRLPYLYAPVRACLRGPGSDARTVGVLLVPLRGGEPSMELAALPDDPMGHAVARARDDILAEARAVFTESGGSADALATWWESRAAYDADGVYLARPMGGAADDLGVEAAALLRGYAEG